MPWHWLLRRGRQEQRHRRASTGETLGEEDVREYGGASLSKPVTKQWKQLEE